MTQQQIHDLVLNKTQEYVKDFQFSGFQAAIFDDVCEKISKSNTAEKLSGDGIILATLTAFQTSHQMMKGAINALLKIENSVNINYGEKAFQFNKDTIV